MTITRFISCFHESPANTIEVFLSRVRRCPSDFLSLKGHLKVNVMVGPDFSQALPETIESFVPWFWCRRIRLYAHTIRWWRSHFCHFSQTRYASLFGMQQPQYIGEIKRASWGKSFHEFLTIHNYLQRSGNGTIQKNEMSCFSGWTGSTLRLQNQDQ